MSSPSAFIIFKKLGCVCVCVLHVSCSIIPFFGESFSLNLEPIDLTELTGQQGPEILLSLPPQRCLAFNVSDGDLSTGPHSLSSKHFLQTNTSVPGPFVNQSYSL